MRLCLSHPEHGYYMKKDPFGAAGDFTTTPEISQIFGEMIGAWIADTWIKMDAPERFILLECGPGRGTLMQDALRVTKSVNGFHDAMRLTLLETSPVLMEQQKQKLDQYDPRWIQSLEELPDDCPVIIIGNEFLDALPIRQLRPLDTKWLEINVGLDKNDTLCLGEVEASKELIDQIPATLFLPQEGDIIEVSTGINSFITDVLKITLNQKGVALFIDYGFDNALFGDTLQAVYKHEYCSILEHSGDADLTAHVNFSEVKRIALEKGAMIHGATSQSDFLIRLGAKVRAEKLQTVASPKQSDDIEAALQRLIGTSRKSGEMGDLFKVIAISSDPDLDLAGFA